jgi:hypothetical protein
MVLNDPRPGQRFDGVLPRLVLLGETGLRTRQAGAGCDGKDE